MWRASVPPRKLSVSNLPLDSVLPLLLQFVTHSQSYHISSSQTLSHSYRISHTVQRTYTNNIDNKLDETITVY
jgi:hypothetical protein